MLCDAVLYSRFSLQVVTVGDQWFRYPAFQKACPVECSVLHRVEGAGCSTGPQGDSRERGGKEDDSTQDEGKARLDRHSIPYLIRIRPAKVTLAGGRVSN